jgi:drug/metabolite transporter (DMT)-like permease
MIVFGIYLLAPKVSFESEYFIGICFGVFSAVCYAIRNIMLKPKVKKYNQSLLMLNQLSIVAVLLLPTLYFLESSKIIGFLPETVLLGILTTAIGHTLFVYSLKNFSTSSASLISSLQPIYAIILAIIFLREYPNINTLLGGLVIVSTVLVESYRVKQKQ